MIDGVPQEAHGAFMYALSGCLLMVVEIIAIQHSDITTMSWETGYTCANVNH